jgi:hypothetical protein
VASLECPAADRFASHPEAPALAAERSTVHETCPPGMTLATNSAATRGSSRGPTRQTPANEHEPPDQQQGDGAERPSGTPRTSPAPKLGEHGHGPENASAPRRVESDVAIIAGL